MEKEGTCYYLVLTPIVLVFLDLKLNYKKSAFLRNRKFYTNSPIIAILMFFKGIRLNHLKKISEYIRARSLTLTRRMCKGNCCLIDFIFFIY